MATVTARDLRNHTADVLRRVAAGEQVTITVRGEPVADLHAVVPSRPQSMRGSQFLALLTQADPGLRGDLAALDGTTDDLGPIR